MRINVAIAAIDCPAVVLYQGGFIERVVAGRGAIAGRLRAWLPLFWAFFFPLIATAQDYTGAGTGGSMRAASLSGA